MPSMHKIAITSDNGEMLLPYIETRLIMDGYKHQNMYIIDAEWAETIRFLRYIKVHVTRVSGLIISKDNVYLYPEPFH